jgi:hypothetical protein
MKEGSYEKSSILYVGNISYPGQLKNKQKHECAFATGKDPLKLFGPHDSRTFHERHHPEG